MTIARSLNRALDRLEEFFTATVLAIMTVLTFNQVVLRYVFDTGLVWLLEATSYLFSWLVLIGISAGIRTDSHIAVELLTERLSPRAQKLMALAAVGLSLLYAVLMFTGSFTLVQRLHDFGSLAHDIPLPRWVLLSSLPIGFALLGLRLGQAALGIWKGTRGALGHRAEQAEVRPEGQVAGTDVPTAPAAEPAARIDAPIAPAEVPEARIDAPIAPPEEPEAGTDDPTARPDDEG